AARLHRRWNVLRDPEYEQLWATRMGQIEDRLRAISEMLEGDAAQRPVVKASRTFARYRALASTERDGSVALRPLPPDGVQDALRENARARRALRSVEQAFEATATIVDTQARLTERATYELLRATSAIAGLLALILSGWVAIRVARGLRRLAWV